MFASIEIFAKQIVRTSILAFATVHAPSHAVQAAGEVFITIHTSATQAAIPVDFMGLSFETSMLLPDAHGHRYFELPNAPLLGLFRSFGIRSLRIGGNTADDAQVRPPMEQDIDVLFAFAAAADLRVIYTLRLKGITDPTDDVRSATYILKRYGNQLQCLAIGNEPNMYLKSYAAYRRSWDRIHDAILASAGGKAARFCGPSSTQGHAEWSARFAGDLEQSGRISVVTQHFYLGTGKGRSDAGAVRDEMLSPATPAVYQKLYHSFADDLSHTHLGYRLSETGSFYHGGVQGATNSLAASLWGLDYIYWWLSHGAAGLNFHTVGRGVVNQPNLQGGYSPYVVAPVGYYVQPLGYAIKAFQLGAHGNLVSTDVRSPDGINITVYATVSGDRVVNVTVVNKEHGSAGRAAHVLLSPGSGYANGEAILLNAPGDDASRTDGIVLGHSSIGGNGSWGGKWASMAAPNDQGAFQITIAPATAAIIRLTPAR